MLAYFLRLGSLPWMGSKGKSKREKYESIRESKSGITFEELLDGHPIEFIKYMKYCRSLSFE